MLVNALTNKEQNICYRIHLSWLMTVNKNNLIEKCYQKLFLSAIRHTS